MGKKENITIDLMRKEDIDQVLAIEKASFSMPWSRNLFVSEFRSSSVSTLLVALTKDPGRRIAGYIVYWLIEDEMHILNLAVETSYRRQGIARRLVHEALKLAYSRGARRSFLEVRASNRAAKELYSSLGFTGTSVRRDYYDSPVEDAVVMSLESAPYKAIIKQ